MDVKVSKKGIISEKANQSLLFGLKPGQEVQPYLDPTHGHIMPSSVVVTPTDKPGLFYEVPKEAVIWN
jgi:hypothetical protein